MQPDDGGLRRGTFTPDGQQVVTRRQPRDDFRLVNAQDGTLVRDSQQIAASCLRRPA